MGHQLRQHVGDRGEKMAALRTHDLPERVIGRGGMSESIDFDLPPRAFA